MKILIGVALALAVLLGITPYFVGGKIESAALAQLEQYQMPGYQYSLEVDRGYRSSQLTYRFSLDPEMLSSSYSMSQEQIDEVLQIFEQFELNLYAQHGPLLTQNGFGFGLVDAYTRIDGEEVPELSEYLALAGVDYLVTAKGRMGFSGSGDAHYEIPAMQYVDADTGLSSSFAGLIGTSEFEDYGLYSKISVLSEGANLAGEDNIRIDIGAMSFNAEMILDPEFVWLSPGSGDFLVQSIAVSSPEQGASLEGLSFEFSVSDGTSVETTDIEYSISLASLEAEKLNIEDAEISLVYESLSDVAMRDYMDVMTGVPIGDEQAAQAALMQFALTELPQALSFSPAISVPRLAFTHEGRTFEGNFRLAIDGQKLPVPVSFAQPFTLLPAAVADLNVDADETLVNDLLAWRAATSVDASFAQNPEYELTAEMRQTMIDQQASMSLGIAESQGFVLVDNGRVRSSIHLQDRVLDINGTAMPLPF